MKKLYILFIILLFILSLDFKEKTVTTFKVEDNSYALYELSFNEKIINTNNFNSYFKDLKVISITPFINEIYVDKINFKEYKFNPISNYNNLDKFNKLFINMLDNNGYKSDALNSTINGIYIKKITLYCSMDDIEIIRNQINFDFRQI